MKNVKALLLSLTLVCLLAPAALSSGGTMTSGGDRTSPTPTPAPFAQGSTEGGIAEEPLPDADGREGLNELMIREALVWIASWAALL